MNQTGYINRFKLEKLEQFLKVFQRRTRVTDDADLNVSSDIVVLFTVVGPVVHHHIEEFENIRSLRLKIKNTFM
jgi:hypothetical protein